MKKHRAYRFPTRSGHRYRLWIDGHGFFPAMERAIANARRYVLLEFYLCESGALMERFILLLAAAAQRGVRVCLLLDAYGAMGLQKGDRERLCSSGVDLAFYNPLRLARWGRNLFRDHRKLLVVDGEVAFTGGAGLTDDFDPDLRPETWWHDTMLEIRGPCVADWHALFARIWNRWAPFPLAACAPCSTPEYVGGGLGRVAAQPLAVARSEIMRSYVREVRKARQRVWLATAYFMPSWKLARALRMGARRGCDVRLLLPGPFTDHPSVRHMGRRYYQSLLRHGVRIFEYQPRFSHLKLLLCDDWVSLGSSNADAWNYRWNLEANQEAQDPDLAEQVETMLQEDFARSLEIDLADWLRRPWHRRWPEWFWGRVQALLAWISSQVRPRTGSDEPL